MTDKSVQNQGRSLPSWALALVPVVLVLLILWAMMADGGDGGTGTRARSAPGAVEGAAVLLVFLLTFGSLSLNLLHRLAAVALGAIACLLVGALLGFYHPPDALAYLWARHEPLVLLAGIRLVTELLTASGLFDRLAQRAVWWSGGNQKRLFIGLCLLTYAFSLCLNNLATILVMIPLTLRLADALDLDPVPLVLGEIIASNLGGASTMVGDFPNMLIADVTGTPFAEFLIHLLPVCLVQLVLLLYLFTRVQPAAPSIVARVRVALEALRPRTYNEVAAKRGKLIFGGMVLGFVVGGWLGVAPGLVSLVAGHLAMFAGGIPWRQLVRRDSFDDVFFFACLFLMVGAVEACGILEGPGHGLAQLWRSHPRLGAVALAWGAALLTTVLNAGPTTALLLHLLPSGAGAPSLWALSLGVCAGSSGTLTGATAGPVAAGLLEQRGHHLTFNRFSRTGLPVMLLLLVVSSLYLAIVAG